MSIGRLLDKDATCRKIGGENSPIHPATLYRLVKAGTMPAPIHPAPNISRWIEEEVDEALAKRIAERDAAA